MNITLNHFRRTRETSESTRRAESESTAPTPRPWDSSSKTNLSQSGDSISARFRWSRESSASARRDPTSCGKSSSKILETSTDWCSGWGSIGLTRGRTTTAQWSSKRSSKKSEFRSKDTTTSTMHSSSFTKCTTTREREMRSVQSSQTYRTQASESSKNTLMKTERCFWTTILDPDWHITLS